MRPVDEALAYIHSHQRIAKSSGQGRIRALLSRLGDPQEKLRYIHLAGTNGKGSTAAMLDRICREAGMRTGLFTSPYLVTFHERIRFCGEPISDDDLVRLTEGVRQAEAACVAAGGETPNEFEVVCAIGFCFFLEKGCDIVILEAGIGGLQDSTNVIPAPVCAVITAISLDHTSMLGETTAQIAAQKAGILKPGSMLVTPATQDADALPVLLDAAQNAACPVLLAPEAADVALSQDGTAFSLYGRQWGISLLGAHQVENAACAITAARALGIPDDAIDAGLRNAVWPGRLQRFGEKVLVDCGHNEAGIKSLLRALRLYTPGRDLHFVVAMMRDKAHLACLQALGGEAARITATGLDLPRAMLPEELAAEAAQFCDNVGCTPTLADAMRLPYAPNELRVVCGSVYLAGEALAYFSSSASL